MSYTRKMFLVEHETRTVLTVDGPPHMYACVCVCVCVIVCVCVCVCVHNKFQL